MWRAWSVVHVVAAPESDVASAVAVEPPVPADMSALRDAEMPAEALDDLDSAQWQTYVVAVGILLLCLFIFLSNVSLISPA